MSLAILCWTSHATQPKVPHDGVAEAQRRHRARDCERGCGRFQSKTSSQKCAKRHQGTKNADVLLYPDRATFYNPGEHTRVAAAQREPAHPPPVHFQRGGPGALTPGGRK